MTTDTEVILDALQKQRDELHEKIMQVDRIIKRVKSLEYSNDEQQQPVKELEADNKVNLFPQRANIKVQVLRVFDIIGHVARLKEIQIEYNKLSGNKYTIRETVRSLQRSGLLRMMREKDDNRIFLWAKSDWLANGQLIDAYKTEGFDILYKPENISFE